jgi:hypothetical protein
MNSNPPKHALGLLADVLTRMPAQGNGWVFCGRTDLTRAFAHHPNRPGSYTTAQLTEFVTELAAQGLACEVPRPGKPPSLVFRPLTVEEYQWRRARIVGQCQDPEPTDPVAQEKRSRLNLRLTALAKCGARGGSPMQAHAGGNGIGSASAARTD